MRFDEAGIALVSRFSPSLMEFAVGNDAVEVRTGIRLLAGGDASAHRR